MTAGAANRMISSGDVALAVSELGDPQRPTVVLVHGYPDTKEMWGPVAQLLAADFHVVAYDVRGAGGSTAPRSRAAYGFERLIADFAAICDAVAPGKLVHLVGHDWGGIQGWEFVASEQTAGRVASFTSIAGPALGHALRATRGPLLAGRPLRSLRRARRSWYIAPLLMPGGPTVVWRALLPRRRWREVLARVERVAVDESFPAPTLADDGVNGARLYRANIAPLLGRSAPELVPAQLPLQLVIPGGDRFISPSYYDSAVQSAPWLRRRRLAGSHWAPRGHPERIARWVRELALEAEGREPTALRGTQGWERGGGLEQLRQAVALVTGAGSGIGFATAAELAGRGARVLLVDRDEAALARAAEAIPNARALTCDVSDVDSLERLAAEVLSSEGVPDVVVNNAGIGLAGAMLDTSAEQWRRIVDINLLGVAHGCRLFGRAMVERGLGGQIVNTASAAAFMPSKALPVYATTKAAVLMLSECLRAELAPSGIGVTAVCPGFIATNITQASEYVGRAPDEQQRLRELVTAQYRRRNFTPAQVATEIVAAIGTDAPLAVVTPEAKLMRAIARFTPGLARRLAAIDLLPA